MKVYIATPMYGGSCKSNYVASLYDLVLKLQAQGHVIQYDILTNESLITRARNSIVHNFLKTDFEKLLFIDADQGFNSDDIIKMLETDVDIIAAISPMKDINWDLVAKANAAGVPDHIPLSSYFAVNPDPSVKAFEISQPLEVINIGTGLMSISRRVFEVLAPTRDAYGAHLKGAVISKDPENMVLEFFKTEIDDGVLLSEDYYLCKEWRKLGNKVYAAPWVRITHSGDYTFSGSFAETMLFLSKPA